MYLDSNWSFFWSIVGIGMLLYGRFKSIKYSPKAFAVAYGGLFVGFFYLFTEAFRLITNESFLKSVKTINQPFVFFGLAFISLAYVIVFRYVYKNYFGLNDFRGEFILVWIGITIPELFVHFLPFFEEVTSIIGISYCFLFLIYNSGIIYFLEHSLLNSKLGMFAAVLKLIFEIWLAGVLAHNQKLENVIVYFAILAVLILLLVFLHKKKVEAN